MTTQEYENYERHFREFMEREGLNNLSASRYKCPDCDQPFVCSACPRCGKDGGEFPVEPYFSWSPCIVCDCLEGGDRYDGNGWSERDQCIKEYEGVCGDCVFYAEYGRLDDAMMDRLTE
jgi:hypothetical protein